MNTRKWYEEHTIIFGKIIARTGLTPNQLTILSLIPAFISCYYYYHGKAILGVVFLCVTLLFDVFDGSVARVLNKKTNFGAVLDASIDRDCEIIVLFGILLGGLAESWIVYFCFSGMIMASYVRARIESKGVSAMSVGLMERFQKMTLIIAGSVFMIAYGESLNIALFVVGLLSHITSAQRLLYGRRNLP
jgi:archaetidylinositol phosphate synthase